MFQSYGRIKFKCYFIITNLTIRIKAINIKFPERKMMHDMKVCRHSQEMDSWESLNIFEMYRNKQSASIHVENIHTTEKTINRDSFI